MQALKETRPFNRDHAKAGAPYACRCGYQATIFKWDGRGSFPLIGSYADEAYDISASWKEDGRYDEAGDDPGLDLVMTPLGHIDGKPVFVGDKLVVKCTTMPHTALPFDKSFHNLAWPAPEKDYPVTAMSGHDLWLEYCANAPGSTVHAPGLVAVANAALRHAIDAGQVVPMEEHCAENERVYLMGQADAKADAKADRAARDMAVATAVLAAVKTQINAYSTGCLHYVDGKIDLSKIIAEVQP